MSEVIESIDITMPNGEIRRFSLNILPFTDVEWVNYYVKGLYTGYDGNMYLEYNGVNWYFGVTDYSNKEHKINVTNGGFILLNAESLGVIFAIIKPLPTDNIPNQKIYFRGTEYSRKVGYTPIISAYLSQEKNLQSLSSKIYNIEKKTTKIQFTDNDVVNSCIVEMYDNSSNYGSGRSFKFENNKWYFYSNYNYKELKDGFNVFYEVTSGLKVYIIWKGISDVSDGSYSIKTGEPVIDISYSPAIASYIATEKLIEEKLSSIN